MKVAVCITTYKRSDRLFRLLRELEKLTFTRIIPDELQIVVVDNNTDQCERERCELLSQSYKWQLVYVAEPQRGISFARNRAIITVRDDVDFLAFIDDDEVVEPQWLEDLLHVQQEYKANIVTGPVLSIFEGTVPDWVKKGKFFDRERYCTGHRLKYASTGNVLMSCSMLRETESYFDSRFALTGGEDTHFFMRLQQMGYTIIWADDAVVYEYVPDSRVTPEWIIKRAYRTGNSITFCEIDLTSSIRARIKRLFFGTGNMAQGFMQLFASPLLGKHVYVGGIRRIYRGLGMIAAIMGSHYEEYRNVH